MKAALAALLASLSLAAWAGELKHFAVIADGVAGSAASKHGANPGPAYAGIKVWASSPEEAIQTARQFAEQAGFKMTGKIDVYETKPSEPARDTPHAYDIKFTSYAAAKKK